MGKTPYPNPGSLSVSVVFVCLFASPFASQIFFQTAHFRCRYLLQPPTTSLQYCVPSPKPGRVQEYPETPAASRPLPRLVLRRLQALHLPSSSPIPGDRHVKTSELVNVHRRIAGPARSRTSVRNKLLGCDIIDLEYLTTPVRGMR
jgi:hypothetical protein